MRPFAPALLLRAGLCLTLPLSLHANGWLGISGDAASDYHRAAVSAGGTVDKAEQWSVNGEFGSGETLVHDPDGSIHSTDGRLGLGYASDGVWGITIDGNYYGDTSNERSARGILGLNLHHEIGNFKPAVNLSGGGTNYITSQDNELSQHQEGLNLNFGLGPMLSLESSGTLYQYSQDPYTQTPPQDGSVQTTTVPGNNFLFFQQGPVIQTTYSPGRPGSSTANPLLVGFPKRDWSAGLTLTLPKGATLNADYSQSKVILDDVWIKAVSASWRQDWAKQWSTRLSWSKAVESGADSPYFNLALIYYFSPRSHVGTNESERPAPASAVLP